MEKVNENHGCPGRFVPVLPAIAEEDLGLLPSRYDVDRLYAVPRDPENVFATWEISGATRAAGVGRNLRIVFRFDNGSDTVERIDDVIFESGRYYCPVPSGMTRVSVALGWASGAGFEQFASFGPIGLAIAFVRSSDAVFAKVDPAASLEGCRFGEGTFVPSGTVPAAFVEGVPSAGQEPSQVRTGISEMPVSGRK